MKLGTLAGLLAPLLMPAPARAQSSDPWWGRDKALHFGVSAGLSAGGYAASALLLERPGERALAGAALALSAGVVKELLDLAGAGDPSWRDLAWDGIGTAVGVGIAVSVDVWLLEPQGRGARRSTARLAVRF